MDRFSHDGGEALELAGLAEACQAAIREVPQARAEHKAQKVEPCEDIVRDAAGIDVVGQRIELGGVSHKLVQDERRLAGGSASQVGMERTVPPGQERIVLETRVRALLGVDLP